MRQTEGIEVFRIHEKNNEVMGNEVEKRFLQQQKWTFKSFLFSGTQELGEEEEEEKKIC